MSDSQSEPETTVLIVDDEEVIRDSFGMTLTRAGYKVLTAASGQEGLRALNDNKDVAVVVSDIRMPGMDGLELLARIKEEFSRLPVIIISAHGTPEDAARAIKLGALDYFSKPFSAAEIEARIGKAVEHHSLAEEAQQLRAETETLREVVKRQQSEGSDLVCARTGPMADLKQTLTRIAASDSTVLLQGESGTGKEVIAKYIHANSARAGAPFLAVNCAALSAGLLESELFGHEKGAFTNADRQRKGRFELANGGTLLLDEVSEIDIGLQAKLLRVLQERCFERVGSSDSIHVDVRVLATTNRDLGKAVKEGSFREDLFFRLNVLPVQIAPLRERKMDIPVLAEFFVDMHGRTMGRRDVTIDEEALGVLKGYGWPGNVRELENLLERVMVLETSNSITGEVLRRYMGAGGQVAAPSTSGASAGFTLPSGEDDVPSISEVEGQLILWAMQRLAGDKNAVADALGITTKTLRTKLKKLGVE